MPVVSGRYDSDTGMRTSTGSRLKCGSNFYLFWADRFANLSLDPLGHDRFDRSHWSDVKNNLALRKLSYQPFDLCDGFAEKEIGVDSHNHLQFRKESTSVSDERTLRWRRRKPRT